MIEANGIAYSVQQEHRVDEQGKPAGGTTTGTGFEIEWQNGPRGRDESGNLAAPNGAFVEDVIAAVIGRLQFYEDSEFACAANAIAIDKLRDALQHLEARRADRRARGVEGSHQV